MGSFLWGTKILQTLSRRTVTAVRLGSIRTDFISITAIIQMDFFLSPAVNAIGPAIPFLPLASLLAFLHISSPASIPAGSSNMIVMPSISGTFSFSSAFLIISSIIAISWSARRSIVPLLCTEAAHGFIHNQGDYRVVGARFDADFAGLASVDYATSVYGVCEPDRVICVDEGMVTAGEGVDYKWHAATDRKITMRSWNRVKDSEVSVKVQKYIRV
jgi:hypothetical protein